MAYYFSMTCLNSFLLLLSLDQREWRYHLVHFEVSHVLSQVVGNPRGFHLMRQERGSAGTVICIPDLDKGEYSIQKFFVTRRADYGLKNVQCLGLSTLSVFKSTLYPNKRGSIRTEHHSRSFLPPYFCFIGHALDIDVKPQGGQTG